MAQRSIGRQRFGFASNRWPVSSPDELARLIDWRPVAALLEALYRWAKSELARPPQPMFEALLMSV